MSWNLRVVKEVFDDEEQYSIRETYYNKDGEICKYMNSPTTLACKSIPALNEYLEWCLRALDKPIIEDKDFVFAEDD